MSDFLDVTVYRMSVRPVHNLGKIASFLGLPDSPAGLAACAPGIIVGLAITGYGFWAWHRAVRRHKANNVYKRDLSQCQQPCSSEDFQFVPSPTPPIICPSGHSGCIKGSAIFHQGTTAITGMVVGGHQSSGGVVYGQSQTHLAARATPPPKNFGLWFLFAFVVLSSSVIGWMLGTFVGFLYWLFSVLPFKRSEYATATDYWQKQWYCPKCDLFFNAPE